MGQGVNSSTVIRARGAGPRGRGIDRGRGRGRGRGDDRFYARYEDDGFAGRSSAHRSESWEDR